MESLCQNATESELWQKWSRDPLAKKGEDSANGVGVGEQAVSTKVPDPFLPLPAAFGVAEQKANSVSNGAAAALRKLLLVHALCPDRLVHAVSYLT